MFVLSIIIIIIFAKVIIRLYSNSFQIILCSFDTIAVFYIIGTHIDCLAHSLALRAPFHQFQLFSYKHSCFGFFRKTPIHKFVFSFFCLKLFVKPTECQRGNLKATTENEKIAPNKCPENLYDNYNLINLT